MASLTEVAITSRKVIRYSVYAVVLIIVGRLTLTTGISIYQRLFPPPPPPPTVAFGKLPFLPMPEKTPVTGLSFMLETPTGNLPEFPNQIPVYFMPSPVSSLNALDKAKDIAGALGFNKESGKIVVENVPNVYVFTKNNSTSNLTINIITGVWSISRDLRSEPSLVSNQAPPPENAIQTAQSTLRLPGQQTADMTGEPRTQLLKLESGSLVSAVSLSEANITKVNLFRKAFGPEGEYPSVTAEFPDQANVWFLLSSTGIPGIIAGEYHYFPIDEKTLGTYPTITAQQAWDQLTAGNAYITNIGNNSANSQITIRRVYLGYFDPGQYAQFYQPVAVFEGDNEFAAIVPAITPEYYGQE